MLKNSFRLEHASLDDVDQLTVLHRLVFSGTIGVTLGEKYNKRFIEWFIANSKTVLVARADESIVGYIFGAPSGYTNDMNNALLSVVLRAVLIRPWVLLDLRLLRQLPSRLKSVLRISMHSQSPSAQHSNEDRHVYRLTAIGISPAYRGRGLGKILIGAYEQSVWSQGFDQIQLSVYVSNIQARKLYESCGWHIVSNNGKLMVFAKRSTT